MNRENFLKLSQKSLLEKNLKTEECEYTVALAGSPNVGKSTIFNSLTGLRHHTGNWSGKTVSLERGVFRGKKGNYSIVDLPGTYSLFSGSCEQDLARDYICFGKYDLLVVVLDGTNLERNLILALQMIEAGKNVMLCVNIMDEAKKKGIEVDINRLREMLKVKVVGMSSRDKKALGELQDEIEKGCLNKRKNDDKAKDYYDESIISPAKALASHLERQGIEDLPLEFISMRLLCGEKGFERGLLERLGEEFDVEKELREWKANNLAEGFDPIEYHDGVIKGIVSRAGDVFESCVKRANRNHSRDLAIDKVLTSAIYGFPVMLLLVAVVFFITLWGANYVSDAISFLLDGVVCLIKDLLVAINTPEILCDFFINGILGTLSTVVCVMLPPMAIFFPLFTLLEDSGYLPRVAYNLDKPFKKCNTCGKQALSMCMGLGCNAAGVIGCRIIEGKKERVIAAVTNSFMPCNGKLASMVTVVGLFIVSGEGAFSNIVSVAILLGVVIIGTLATFVSSYLLSKTLLRSERSSFVLELPPYRRPQIIRVLVRSVFDKTLNVLSRAVMVAIPAGALIWILGNFKVGDTALLVYLCRALDSVGRVMGLDGVILAAFLLSFPANEIVLPLVIMGYTSSGVGVDVGMRELFVLRGWDVKMALCFVILCAFHMPCSTTLISIKKETGSIWWSVVAAILPSFVGVILCVLINAIFCIIL